MVSTQEGWTVYGYVGKPDNEAATGGPLFLIGSSNGILVIECRDIFNDFV